jgi:hypothetical protein
MIGDFSFGYVGKNITEIRESPILWLPGVNDYIQVHIKGTGTLASPTMVLYENGVDVSGTKLTGSMSIPTGSRVIKTKTFSSLIGGSQYRVYIYFTDDGVSQVRELEIFCPKLGTKPSNYPVCMDRLKVAESPIVLYPGQSIAMMLTVDGQGEIASPTMSMYKGTSDDSTNVLSGSITASGRTITLKTISSLTGGSSYTAYVYFTDNGKNTVRYFEVICKKLGVY